MTERRLDDGSVDYGNGIVGPSESDIQVANRVYFDAIRLGVSESLTPATFQKPEVSLPLPFLINRLPKRFRYPVLGGLAAVGIAAAACSGGDGSTEGQSPDQGAGGDGPSVGELENEPGQFVLPLRNINDQSEPVFLTGGPHFDGLTGGVRAAIDLAGKVVVRCPGGETSRDMAAIAPAVGTVTVVGNENDPTDPNHSVVEIDLGSGVTVGIMHLDNMQVKVGQQVNPGDVLGFISCEVTPGGATEGQHEHVYVKVNGQYVPIGDLVLSGWQIHESPNNYQGTATKEGQTVRTADRRRCDTDTACGGLRNDLPAGEVLGARTDQETPQPATVPEPQVEATETGAEQQSQLTEVEQSREGILDLGNWQIAVTSWEETTIEREGWRRVLIKGFLQNSSGIVRRPYDEVIASFREGVVIQSSDGFEYEADIGSLSDSGLEPWWEVPDLVPPGFSVPIGIFAEVPQNRPEYSLVAYSSQIRRGEVAADFSLISPEVKIKDAGEAWEFPGYASIYFNRVVTKEDRGMVSQYLSFDFQNNSGQDIRNVYGREIRLLIFLPDGEVISADNSDYLIAPGLRKAVDIYIGSPDIDVRAGVAVLFFNDGWSAWRIQ